MAARLNQVKGFTLIELLVVISIIAILSVIGIVVFTNVQTGARDSRRKADIDAIAKTYEVKYNNSGSYGDLTPTANEGLFSSGGFPKDPSGEDYTIIQNESSGGFLICAGLGDGKPCSNPSNSCFCKTSTQADPPGVSTGQSVVVTNDESVSSAPSCDPSLSSGLVGHWKMDEGGGSSVADASGNNNTATLQGGTTWGNGVILKAVNLNGSGYLQIGDKTSLDFGTNFTLTAWINPSSAPGGDGASIVGKIKNYGEGSYGYIMQLRPLQVSGMMADGPGQYTEFFGQGAAVGLNTWTHLTLTYDGANMNGYINGVLQATKASSRIPKSSGYDFRIGQSNNTYYFSGLIDEVRVYNKVLSPAEISSLYNNGSACQ